VFISLFISTFLLKEDRHENIEVKKFETKEVNKELKERKKLEAKVGRQRRRWNLLAVRFIQLI
jgi:hypothetical protein